MTYTIVPYTTRQEWLALRRSGIGASDIAAIMGVSPWSTPRQVWISKVEPEAPEPMSNEDMDWGLRMERLIVDEACQRLGAAPLHYGPLMKDNDRPWMMATPDATANDLATDKVIVVEAKKVDDWAWDEIPTHYHYQVQWQLAVTGLDKAVLAALHRGRRLELYEVERDEEVISELVEAGEWFWGLCEREEPPPVEAADSEYLGWLWPDSFEAAVEIPQELADDLLEARARLKAAQLAVDAATAMVKDYLGEADTAVDESGRVVATWRSSESSRLDVKMLRAEEPEVAATYTKQSKSRRFLVKEVSK